MTTESPTVEASTFPNVKFSHVQLYVDQLDSLESYKDWERSLQEFWSAVEASSGTLSLEEKRAMETRFW